MAQDFTIDERFNFLENYVEMIVTKKLNSLIISGNSGMGKTWRTTKIIKKHEVKPFMVKGFSTARAMYDALYYNKHNLVIFDDCDSVLEDKIAINILKSALDSYDDRIVSWLSKTSKNDKIPTSFNFEGQIIFISNIPLAKLDKAILSRALTIDVFMSVDDKIEMFEKLIAEPSYFSDMAFLYKRIVLNELLPYMDKECINFRTLNKALTLYKGSQNTDIISYMANTC